MARPTARFPAMLAAALAAAPAAAADAPRYSPRETFAPFDMEQAVNAYRGADGLPGPGYWRNRADC